MLGTLAPSMQLELLQKMREKKTYINREKFAQHTGRPLDFSSFQMQQYLQSSAFRLVAVWASKGLSQGRSLPTYEGWMQTGQVEPASAGFSRVHRSFDEPGMCWQPVVAAL